MKLIPLDNRDLIVDSCGRLVPPKGHVFVDLVRIIPLSTTQPGQGEGGLPPSSYTVRVNNNSNSLFICTGLMREGSVSHRIKWPNGRYFSQKFSQPEGNSGRNFPGGIAGNGFALDVPQHVGKGQRITVEIQGGTGVDGGTLNLWFWGVLRYLVKAADLEAGENACLIGYPTRGQNAIGDSLQSLLVDSPLEALRERPRFFCANANIRAAEWQLSNQCFDLLDEPFQLLSDVYTVEPNEVSDNNAVLIPGSDDMVLRAWRPIVTAEGETTAEATLSIRLPNGYSMMGGDLIPVTGLYWVPVFTTIRTRAGDRLILDVSSVGGALNEDPLSLQVEFMCTKRRRA